MPATLVPASNPQPSTTATETKGVSPTSAEHGHPSPHLSPQPHSFGPSPHCTHPFRPRPCCSDSCRPRLPYPPLLTPSTTHSPLQPRPLHTLLQAPPTSPPPLHPLLQATPTTPTPAGPSRTGRPGLGAILAAHVVWAGAVVVPLQVVAPGPVLAGAWLAEVDVHLWGGCSHEGAAGTGRWARAHVPKSSPRDPGPTQTRQPGLCSQSLEDSPAQPVCPDPWLDGNTWAGQAPPPPRPGAALFRGLPGRHPAFAPPTGSRSSCGSF